jgi:hypothetical protein
MLSPTYIKQDLVNINGTFNKGDLFTGAFIASPSNKNYILNNIAEVFTKPTLKEYT